jgi:hypothetical protein
LQWWSRLKISFCEIFGVVQFSTFATLSAQKRTLTKLLDDVPTTQDFRANRDSKLTNLTAWIASFVRVPCR